MLFILYKTQEYVEAKMGSKKVVEPGTGIIIKWFSRMRACVKERKKERWNYKDTDTMKN